MFHVTNKSTPNELVEMLQYLEVSDKSTPSEIVSQMLRYLEVGDEKLKIVALRVLTAIATSLKDEFQEHYSRVMPYLKVIFMDAKARSKCNLLAATLECITEVWVAVGKEMMEGDLDMVVKWLLTSTTDEPDSRTKYVLRAWGRLCKCLGEEFRPYLTVAMPLLCRSAQLESYIVSANDHEKGDGSLKEIKTSVMEVKTTACVVLCDCILELKEHLNMWTDKIAETLNRLINFEFEEDIRIAVISAVAVLWKSSKEAIMEKSRHQSRLKNLWSDTIKALIEVSNMEVSAETGAIILDSLKECLETGDCSSIFDNSEAYTSPDFSFQVLKLAQVMMDHDKTTLQRRVSLCIFGKVMKERRQELDSGDSRNSLPLRRLCLLGLPHLIHACKAEDPGVKEVVAEAIGVCAEFGFGLHKPPTLLADAIKGLKRIIENPDASQQVKYAMAHDLAISALGKIVQFQRLHIDSPQVLRSWLSYLPIMCHEDVAKEVHEQLAAMVENEEDDLVFDEHHINISKIIPIYAEIFWTGTKFATEETINKMLEQLRREYKRLPPAKWEKIMASMKYQLRQVILFFVGCQANFVF